ncbi:hypothetical protein BE20_00730 [Sorangium cellulosum]|nr:hypothetical protein BE20_00730 [Sorangium cellulosum]
MPAGSRKRQEDPGPRTTAQIKAKAYPGLRELDRNGADYGYRPAIGTIIDRLKTVLGGRCLSRPLTPDAGGQLSCLLLEARNSEGACDCGDRRARIDVAEAHPSAEAAVLSVDIAKAAGWDCVCEIEQLAGAAAEVCRTDSDDNLSVNSYDVHGWCYVDPSNGLGDPAIVADCPSNERRKIRFVGEGEAQRGATLFIYCPDE